MTGQQCVARQQRTDPTIRVWPAPWLPRSPPEAITASHITYQHSHVSCLQALKSVPLHSFTTHLQCNRVPGHALTANPADAHTSATSRALAAKAWHCHWHCHHALGPCTTSHRRPNYSLCTSPVYTTSYHSCTVVLLLQLPLRRVYLPWERSKAVKQVFTSLMLWPALQAWGRGEPGAQVLAAVWQALHMFWHWVFMAGVLKALFMEPAHVHSRLHAFFTVPICFAPLQSYVILMLPACCRLRPVPGKRRWQQQVGSAQLRRQDWRYAAEAYD